MPKLDKRAVEGAQPKGRAYIIWDEDLPGFGLRIYASGRRTYLIQYKEGGRTRQFSMGSHEDLTPAAARQKAKKLLADVAAAGTETAPARPPKPAAQKNAADEPPASVTLSRRPLARVSAASVGPAPSAKSPDAGLRAKSEGLSEPLPPESGFRRIAAVLVLLGVLVIGGLWYASETTELVRTATTTDEPVPPEGGIRQPPDAVAAAVENTATEEPPAQTPVMVAGAPDADDNVAAAAAGDEEAAAQDATDTDDESENAASSENEPAPQVSASDSAAQSDDMPPPNEVPEPVTRVTEAPPAEPPAAGNARIAAAGPDSSPGPRTIAPSEAVASLRPAAGPTAKPPAPAKVATAATETEPLAPNTEEIARLPTGDPDEITEQIDFEQAAEEARRRADRNPPPHECDRLATAAIGAGTEAAGESGSSTGPSAAMRACEDAVNTFPNAARFKAQYANAMRQAGNAEEAVKWDRRAADQGYSAAQYQLGEIFATGSGVSQDYAEAYFWYTLALRRGNVAAGKSRDAIERQLTRYQKESIGQRVRSWRPVP